jgi:hypothetical protein
MKRHITYLLSVGIPLFCSMGAVSATTITLDQDGHGTDGTTPLPFTATGSNPLVPFQTPVLVYTLPFAGVTGDVKLREPETGIPGDVLQFVGNGTVIFYSTPEPRSLAGRFSPPIFPFPVLNTLVLNETASGLSPVSEVVNGAFYTPTSGQPGFDASAPTYHFISDVTSSAVPEPASVALLVLGGAALLIGNLRRRRPRQSN